MQTYEEVFGSLEPRAVLQKFYQVSQVPRVPGRQRQISDHMMAWAKGLGLAAEQDAACNVLVRKPASPGYGPHPPVILQSHLDMVCEKEPQVVHNFDTDPLELYVEKGVLRARGTTLGADDAAGVAMVMALLEDKTAVHPAIEALFTTDEETDMGGAWQFDCSRLTGHTLINLDATAGMVCGAGELEVEMRLAKQTVPVHPGSRLFTVRAGGLLGGHTGANAMKERASAIQLVNRVLLELAKHAPFQLVTMQGGAGMSSAFARDAAATLALEPVHAGALEQAVETMRACYAEELAQRDPDWWVRVEPAGQAETALAEDTARTLMTLLQLLPGGVCTLSKTFAGCMESTANTGVVETDGEEVFVTNLVRAMVASQKYRLYDQVTALCRVLGVKTAVARDIPHWQYRLSPPTRDLMERIYPDCPPTAVEATVEAGIFSAHMPDAEILALGCPFYGAHSPAEYVTLAELKIYYDRLKEFLAAL